MPLLKFSSLSISAPVAAVLLACQVAGKTPAAPHDVPPHTELPEGQAMGPATRPSLGADLVDIPLKEHQVRLLDLAFNAASAIPVDPHLDERTRSQALVVESCLQLDQPHQALQDLRRIEDWRIGMAYSDLALYCAKHGQDADVQRLLDHASLAADAAEDWRRDRIRVNIARVYAWLGQSDRATEFQANVVDAETGKVEAVRAIRLPDNGYDDQLRIIDEMIATENFDISRNALEACVQVFDRFYASPVRREQAEIRVRTANPQLPAMIRMEFLMELIDVALAHGDQSKAYELIVETRTAMDVSPWTPEDWIALRAKLAALRYRAGDARNAQIDIEAAIAKFDAERDNVLTIDRSTTLRPVAEALAVMKQPEQALAMYRRLINEGADNPNARPRALDLTAACCSMAVNGIEPDAVLWKHLREIQVGLVDPW